MTVNALITSVGHEGVSYLRVFGRRSLERVGSLRFFQRKHYRRSTDVLTGLVGADPTFHCRHHLYVTNYRRVSETGWKVVEGC